MHKEIEWFELVIHKDEEGTRATVSKRTRTFEDDGTIDHAATKMESSTLAQLGADFPWKEFMDAALLGALLTIEKHEATISAKEAEKTAALVAKDAELAAKTAEHAAELAARQAKEQEAAGLAAQVEAQADELTVLRMPEEERRNAEKRATIDRLQAELAA